MEGRKDTCLSTRNVTLTSVSGQLGELDGAQSHEKYPH